MKTALLTGPAIFDSGRENRSSDGLNTALVRKYQPTHLSGVVCSILVIKSDDRALLRDVLSLANLLTMYRDEDTRYDLGYSQMRLRLIGLINAPRTPPHATFSVQCNFNV